jgi:hypothetical protein
VVITSLVCGDRVTVVCGWLVGNVQRRRQQGQPWSPPNALDANRAALHPRWPAVWHRDVPLSHLPRGAGILLAAGTALTPVPGLLSLGWQPRIAIPTGLALAWLGYALVSERPTQTSQPSNWTMETV